MPKSLISLALLLLLACDGTVYVRGVVHNAPGNAISGARVYLERERDRRFQVETDAERCFSRRIRSPLATI